MSEKENIEARRIAGICVGNGGVKLNKMDDTGWRNLTGVFNRIFLKRSD